MDADACPVKEEIVKISATYGNEVIFVASYAHVIHNFNGGTWIYVDCNKEEVDLYILNHVKTGDVVITQDMGLASMLVSRGVDVISPRGKRFNNAEMDLILDQRYQSAKQRRSGIYSKGPRPFLEKDRKAFLTEFEKILSNREGIS